MTTIAPRCDACKKPSIGKYDDHYLCKEHLAKAKRYKGLLADLTSTLAAWAQKNGISERELARLCDDIVDTLEGDSSELPD